MNIIVKVKTECGREEIIDRGNGIFEIHTKAKAKEGEANEAVINMIAKYFKRAAKDAVIIKGSRSRNKIIRMPDNI